MKFVSVIISLALVDASSRTNVRGSLDERGIMEPDVASKKPNSKAAKLLGVSEVVAGVPVKSLADNLITCVDATNATQGKLEAAGEKAKKGAKKHYAALDIWLSERMSVGLTACELSYCVVMNKLASYIQDENSWRLFRDSDAEIAADKFESEHPCETAKANAQKDGKEITASIVGKPGLLRSVFFFI